MEVTSENKEALISFAQDKIGITFRDDAKAIGMVHDGDIKAAVIYDTFTPYECSIHIASDGSRKWLTRSLLLEAFNYPFVTCGLQRLSGYVIEGNEDAIRFDLRLGFKLEGKMRKAWKGHNVHVLGMLREECIFIPKRYRHAA